jgi:oligopeptidase B
MKDYTILFLIINICLMQMAAYAQSAPVAKKNLKVTKVHGIDLIDNYHWLRDREDPDTMKYLEAENQYTDEIMKDTLEFQNKLFEEMKGRIKETDLSVPQKHGPYIYYSRTEEGKQYEIHCRKSSEENAKEEIIFDENQYAEGQPYFALGALSISPNHEILAFSIDNSGAEKFELKFLNLKTNKLSKDIITQTTYGVQWAEDNKTVFYTLPDESGRAYKINKHKLGDPINKDKTIYEEKDGQFWVRVGKTRDDKYITISTSSTTSSEVLYLDANKPNQKPKIFKKRKKNVEYGITHHEGYFYIITNEKAVNFKVMRTKVGDTKKVHWETFIEAQENAMIEDFDEFKDHLAVVKVVNGLKKLEIYSFADKTFKEIPFNEAVYNFNLASNPEYDTEVLRYQYESLTTPNSIYEYNVKTGKTELLKQSEVLGGQFEADNYRAERLYARADDGVAVPISLVYKKSLSPIYKDEPAPLYLTAYGSYGSSYDPYFSSIRLSLLDRGVVFAIAHIRGGQELGRPWYNDGKMLKKKNTFTDFVACAKYLIDYGFTSKEKLVINGGSAGGLLMGAVTNSNPELFKAVVAEVPFVDIMNTMLDPSLPLVKEEYEEWGNPNEEEYFKYILSYSPYDNIEAKDYPNMLVTAGLNDPRVSYWEPAKYVAKLRANKTDKNHLILKTNMDAGHSGASGRYDYLKEIAFEYAFILKILGLVKL